MTSKGRDSKGERPGAFPVGGGVWLRHGEGGRGCGGHVLEGGEELGEARGWGACCRPGFRGEGYGRWWCVHGCGFGCCVSSSSSGAIRVRYLGQSSIGDVW